LVPGEPAFPEVDGRDEVELDHPAFPRAPKHRPDELRFLHDGPVREVHLLSVRLSSLAVRAVRRLTVRPHVEDYEPSEDEESRGEGGPKGGGPVNRLER
jgi:hypothetical protein